MLENSILTITITHNRNNTNKILKKQTKKQTNKKLEKVKEKGRGGHFLVGNVLVFCRETPPG